MVSCPPSPYRVSSPKAPATSHVPMAVVPVVGQNLVELARALGDVNLRHSLIARGRARASLFTWERSAGHHVDLYCALADGRNEVLTEHATVGEAQDHR